MPRKNSTKRARSRAKPAAFIPEDADLKIMESYLLREIDRVQSRLCAVRGEMDRRKAGGVPACVPQ